MLGTVNGFKIPFINNIRPIQISEPPQYELSKTEENILLQCISKLISIGAITKVKPCTGQFISSIFFVPKPDGSSRFILNLKSLNEYVDNPHFKMEDFRSVSKVLNRNDFMAKVDLKDAYYSIPISPEDRKFLRFRFRQEIYEYTCLPFGLSCAPRVFTKLLKPLIIKLRKQKFRSVVFLDDFLLLGCTEENLNSNVNATKELLTNLGFVINTEKSILNPTTEIEFLGFHFDSKDMSISLPERKREKVLTQIETCITKRVIKTLDLAKCIGTLISASPAIPYSMLYTRHLEILKQKALNENGNSFKGQIELSELARNELIWWKANIPNKKFYMLNDFYEYEFYSDSSLSGWGCIFGTKVARGFWTLEEQDLHINTLELFAVLNGLNAFFRNCHNCQILVRCDSTTAICYINKHGGCRSEANHKLAKEIWKWCEEREIWLFASYINTKDNVDADKASRVSLDDNDFSLDNVSYKNIIKAFGIPEIDLFATSVTNKCTRFASWYPDPKSEFVDAFTVVWKDFFYAFPPFNLINRVIKKIINEKAEGIVVAPYWKGQVWYPTFCNLVKGKMIILKKGNFQLENPYTSSPHPLSRTLNLMAAVLSGRT